MPRRYMESNLYYCLLCAKHLLQTVPFCAAFALQVLYALAWTFPLWVEAAPEGFGSAAVTYLVDWVVGFEASCEPAHPPAFIQLGGAPESGTRVGCAAIHADVRLYFAGVTFNRLP